MIYVRLYGLLRLDSGIRELTLEAKNIRELLEALAAASPCLSRERLRSCVILRNGKPLGKHAALQEGDRIMILSPVAGG